MHPTMFMARGKAPSVPALSDADRAARLERLGAVIAGKRKEAVDARKESGIEAVWLSCEEAYLGIDDANRHEFNDAKWSKPTSINGPVTKDRGQADDTRSNAFVRLTSRYVDGASSKLSEIILPVDDKAFELEATPDPDLVKQAKDLTPLIDQATGQPVPKPQEEPDATTAQPGQPAATSTGVMTHGELAKQMLQQAQDCADKAETRIYDWMVESKYPAEARKVIHDAARIGVGVLKGPFPEYREARALTKLPQGGVAIQIQRKIAPAVRWVDPWNIFPDDGCGEDIHSGEGLFERDFLSTKKLKKLKDDRQYLPAQIDVVLKEGPGKVYAEGNNPNEKKKRNRWEIWYYYGTLKREDFELVSAGAADDLLPQEQDEVHVIVSMVNDTIIRAVVNPLDSGAFPYRVMTWSRRAGHWAGVGVGEQVAMPQRAVNAATRALFNNAGWSAGVQIIIDQLGIVPADNNWKITPNKIWLKTGESTAQNVQDAFSVVEFPSVQPQLTAIIEYGMKLAEESTAIPLVTQGQTGPTTPQTFGQAELQDNNAHTWLRNIGYRYDDMITEPLVQDLYEWLLLDPDVPDEEKGDFQINANGSIAMVERAIQEQTLMGLLGASVNPALRIAPHKLASEILKTKRLDPRKIQYSDEEWQQISQQPPPLAPQVQAAQINAAGALHKQEMVNRGALQQVAAEAQHEQQLLQSGGVTPHMASATARIEQERIRAETAQNVEASRAFAERERAQKEFDIAQQNGQFKIQELQLQKEIALLQYATQEKISLDAVKAQLAKSAMDNQTKRELAAAEIQLAQSEGSQDRAVDLHKHNTSLVRDEMSTSKTP